ncbi:MAG: hypothetical protein ACP5N7_02480 [Candidatus Pacearchaeota archaeon]
MKRFDSEFFKYIDNQIKFRELQKRIPILEFNLFLLTPLQVSKFELPKRMFSEDAQLFRYDRIFRPQISHKFRIIFN